MDPPSSKLGTEVSEASRWVARRIISGQLSPGQRLKIRELAALSGIGPTTMREGVSRLVGSGLVLALDQRGYRVGDLNVDDMAVIILLKAELEAALLRDALSRGNAGWRQDMVEALKQLEKSQPAEFVDFPWDSYEADKALHLTILSGCGSALGLRLWSGFYDQWARYMVALAFGGSVAHFIERTQSVDEHRELVNAALAGDVGSALAALARHNATETACLLPASL